MAYGVGRNPKCANCMVHCGFEPTAVNDALSRPFAALRVALLGPRTEGPLAAEPPLIHEAGASATRGVLGGTGHGVGRGSRG